MNTRQHNAWMYAGGGLELMRELFKEYGCVNFPAGNTGAQMGGWFRKEIKSPADLKGPAAFPAWDPAKWPAGE